MSRTLLFRVALVAGVLGAGAAVALQAPPATTVSPVGPVPPMPSVKPFPADADGLYKVDPVHSSVAFKIKHNDVAFVAGRFNEVSGEVALDQKDPAKSRIDILIPAGSVDTNNEARDRHLRTGDYFNVEKNPEIRFRSTSMKRVGNNRWEVAGEMEFMGLKKPFETAITLVGAAQDRRGGYRAGGSASFTISRKEFGMGSEGGGLGDAVFVEVNLEGVRQQADAGAAPRRPANSPAP